ncbi:hypothetical protein K040078D81_44230 [Blautia hominis]|uniref:Uncharacterized protein n=1 Tax=Blautia hominis TaxID=2025493 RepID=A0ABQ0BFR8_9FIRM
MNSKERMVVRKKMNEKDDMKKINDELSMIKKSVQSQENEAVWTIDLSSFLTIICC